MSENMAGLSLDPEAMRRFGYAVVDLLVDYRNREDSVPVSQVPGRAHLEEILGGAIPITPSSEHDVLSQITDHVIPNMSHVNHRRFFAFVPGPGNFVGTMAETLASGLNIFAGTWLGSASAAQIELTVIRWLVEMCSLPSTAGGLFVSGGSVANLTALTVARDQKLGTDLSQGVAYCSNQTHSAVDRALRVLGIPEQRLRRLPVDEQFRLDMDSLERAVTQDREQGLRPFCVIANAGTTNTGAVDPLRKMASFCRQNDLWFHIDGAYGAASVICARGKEALPGLEEADSITLDPHKWLFQPFETGCLLLRNDRLLRDTFSIHPEYMQDTLRDLEEVNFSDRGIQLSRSFRALKVWMTFKIYGRNAVEAAVTHGFEMADLAERYVHSLDNWTVTSPATLGMVSFRYTGPCSNMEAQDWKTREAAQNLRESGHAMVSTTELRGRTVIRMCPINPGTTPEDIRSTLDALDRFASK